MTSYPVWLQTMLVWMSMKNWVILGQTVLVAFDEQNKHECPQNIASMAN